MRRRDFIKVITGSAVAWPLAAEAQQDNPVRRIGMLSNLARDDKEDQRRVEAFRQTLQELGWTVGRNIQIDHRWVLETTQTVPVVFVNVTDPVSGGFVESLARPGGNATGFASAEYGTSGKWLQLLKQIAPEVKRVAVLRDPSIASGSGQLGAIQAVAPLLEVDINPIDVRDAGEIERGLTALSSSSNTGVIVTAVVRR
jgi:putative ABC transport system substrate-binding protein